MKKFTPTVMFYALFNIKSGSENTAIFAFILNGIKYPKYLLIFSWWQPSRRKGRNLINLLGIGEFMRTITLVVFLSFVSAMLVNAELRGTGPFAAWVARSPDGEFYLLNGYTASRLTKHDQEAVAQHIDHFIRFEADSDSIGMPYTNLKDIKRLGKSELQNNPIIQIILPQKSVPYAVPVLFDISFLRGPQKVYSPDTKYIRAAIWTSEKSVPRVVRYFSINRLWGEGIDQTDVPASKLFRRSINVLLPPGEYRLVLEGTTKHYDETKDKWYNGRFLLSKPTPFSVSRVSDSEGRIKSLYGWLHHGPIEERMNAARELVKSGVDTEPLALVLDDLETGVFDNGGMCSAIGFLSQKPSSQIIRAFRILILKAKTDTGIENILSCIPTDNRPDRRPSEITNMLIDLMKEKRFVGAPHSSMSHVRVCDCVAAWLAATTRGSGYFADKSIEEREKMFPKIIAEAKRKIGQ